MIEKVMLFRTTKRIVFGVNAINNLGVEIKHLRGTRAFVVTDPGIVKAGLTKKVEDSLNSLKVPYLIFDRVDAEPSIEVAKKSLETAKNFGCDIIIGLGGGSPLDVAKVTSILIKNQGEIEEYFGVDLVPYPGVATILIPTTAGTGSEVTPIAILSDNREKLKKGIVSQYLFPDVAIVDPALTLGLPPNITALTGMDALTHAIEAFYSINASPLTDLFSQRAMGLISRHIRVAFANGDNLRARWAMMEGSLCAGIAFANAGVAAVHALAYPLGGEFHLAHGLANSLMLPYVMEYNLLGCPDRFAQMAELFGESLKGLSELEKADKAISFVKRLIHDLRIPKTLREVGIPKGAIPHLAEGAMKVTRLLANNPRKLTLEDAIAIYEAAY